MKTVYKTHLCECGSKALFMSHKNNRLRANRQHDMCFSCYRDFKNQTQVIHEVIYAQ